MVSFSKLHLYTLGSQAENQGVVLVPLTSAPHPHESNHPDLAIHLILIISGILPFSPSSHHCPGFSPHCTWALSPAGLALPTPPLCCKGHSPDAASAISHCMSQISRGSSVRISAQDSCKLCPALPQPPLSFTLCSSHSELVPGVPRHQAIPLLGPSTHPCLLFLGNSCASCRFRLESAIREPSQRCPVCCPSPGLPQPTPLPPPQPHPIYCHGLFTHQSSPETANNLKAETVSGSVL